MPANTSLTTARDLGILTGAIQPFSGAVGANDSVDFFKFELTQTSEVTLNLTGLSQGAELGLVADLNGNGVYSATGNDSNERVENDGVNDAQRRTEDRTIQQILVPGTYWAEVYQSRADQNTGYSFSASATPVSELPSDPGDEFSRAFQINDIHTAQSFTDAVGSLDGRDLYQFTLDQTSEVNLNLSGLSDGGELAIVADLDGNGTYNSNDERIEDDGVNDVSNSREDRGLRKTLSPGRYWVEVYTGEVIDNTGYTLNTSATRLPSITPEPGVDFGSSLNLGSLTTQRSLTDSVGSLDRTDLYKFVLNRPSEVRLNLSGLSDEGAELAIAADLNGDGDYDFGSERIENDGVGDFSRSLEDRGIVTALPAGTYWAEVYTGRTSANSGYSLTASATFQPRAPRNDLNGDGKADLYWRNYGDGSNAMWFLDNGAFAGGGGGSVLSTDWRAAALGDFNGDDIADVFWRNQVTGANVIWILDGNGGIASAKTVPTLGTEWELATTGDFNNDGGEDLVWRHRTEGINIVWYLNNGELAGSGELLSLSSDWSLEASGDFNGDGNEDLVWRNTQDGVAAFWYSDGNGNIIDGKTFADFDDLNWRIEGSSDFNGDGQSDLLLRNYGNGHNVVWTMNNSNIVGGGLTSIVADANWQVIA